MEGRREVNTRRDRRKRNVHRFVWHRDIGDLYPYEVREYAHTKKRQHREWLIKREREESLINLDI